MVKRASGKGLGKSAQSLEKIEQWPIDDLVPYAQNARKHGPEQVEQLARSIREYGWTIPILVDEAGEIIAGHGRVMAAQKLGLEEAPVIVARGWSDDKKRAYRIADNKLAENSEWDRELLAIDLAALDIAGEDMGSLGFAPDELQGLLANLPARGGFLNDLAAAAVKEAVVEKVPNGTVRLIFHLTPKDRDDVVFYLNAARDAKGLKTAAEALVAQAREGQKK